MPALLFGSISTLADTSELQRRAFNDAFDAHGVPWRWEQEEYRALLQRSGGAKRIAEQAESTGQEVDAEAVHRSKSELFQKSLAEVPLRPRPGVVETIREGKEQGFKIALVTTTSEENVSALVQALAPDVEAADFDLIVDASQVERSKPDEAAFVFALEALGEAPGDCVAIEDNLNGVEAAQAAGLACAAFPNENTAAHDFGAAEHRVDRLSLAGLRSLIPNG